MLTTPIHYVEPVFRPPSEARSLILQVTNGCSWNRCAFCEMYTAPQKKFSSKRMNDIVNEIQKAAEYYPNTQRIFLADGDAIVLSTRRLLEILNAIQLHFPNVSRVSSYCLPRNVKNKTIDELKELQNAGLKLIYVGAESGDDELLQLIQKGESFQSTVSALEKTQAAGIKSSVMILNGLGGRELSRQHAINSAKLVNETQPHYLATLVVSFPMGDTRFRNHFTNGITLLNQRGLFEEMALFLEHTKLNQTIFRSDHASNYLVLKGVLGRDKQTLLEKLKLAIQTPSDMNLRQEWERGL